MKTIALILFIIVSTIQQLCAQRVEQNVAVKTADSITLYGTLLLPELEQNSTTPVAIIITGSGPTDRDGNNVWMPNNSLRMLAEGLADNGIATIRYDKRGVGESINHMLVEDSLSIRTFVEDAKRWIEFVESDPRLGDITLIGHSEGGKIALVIENDYITEPHKNTQISKLVLIAAAGRTLDKVIQEQFQHQPPHIRDRVERVANQIIDSLKQGKKVENVPIYLNSIFRHSVQNFLIEDFKIDPLGLISQINKPILIVQGTTDVQIKLHDAIALKNANTGAELRLIKDMNHILKRVEGMSQQEQVPSYSNPSLPLHAELVGVIVEFIKKQ